MRGETEVIVVMEEYNRIAAKGIKGASEQKLTKDTKRDLAAGALHSPFVLARASSATATSVLSLSLLTNHFSLLALG